MLLNIITNTPLWVFGLFLALVLIGAMQLNTRSVSRTRAMIMPIAMLGLSIFGVLSDFGLQAAAFAIWLAALLCVMALAAGRINTKQVTYDPASRQLVVPGSGWPLALMMMLFAMKYVAGAATALAPDLTQTTGFTLVACAFYGGVSGGFLARAMPLWRLDRANAAVTAATA